jgi:Mce-associated membrane protein
VSTDQKSDSEAVEITESEATAEAEEATHAEATEPTEPAAPTEPNKSGRLWSRISVAVLAVLLVASLGLTAWLYFFQYRVDQQTGPESQGVALQAAKDGTVALLSYAPETLDKDLDAAKTHLTGDFLSYYTNFTDQVVRVAAKQKSVKTTATVARGAVSEMQPSTAKVLLFVNQVTMSADRQEPAATSSSVLVTLTKVNDSWLISAFDPV